MTIKEQHELLSQQLTKLYSKGESDSIANWVLAHYTGLSNTAVKLFGNRKLSIHEKQLVLNAMNELLKHKPVQYILGEAWFKNMAFYVDENVLIPRPETEELVDWVIEKVKTSKSQKHILEIGTGSGCIAIALKRVLTKATITAIDVSETALRVASRNAEILKTDVEFMQLDFLAETSWEKLPKYDVIVSNPPYIPINEKDKLDKNVTEWEPSTALFVPDADPLLFYKKIAFFGKLHLQTGGIILVECHQDFATATKQLFIKEGYETTLKKDLFDNDRMILASMATRLMQ